MKKIFAYLLENMDNLDGDYWKSALKTIPAFRQEQCAKYRQNIDKNACVAAYQLLTKGLAENFHIFNPPEFVYSQYGKPYLRDTPQIFFSLSHCKKAVVCVLADFELGVDIEMIRPFEMDVAKRICTENELQQLLASTAPSTLSCKIWTMKESFAKAYGIALSHVLRHTLPSEGFICQPNNETFLSIFSPACCAKKAITCWRPAE